MEKKFDVFGMCNALFDLQAEVPESTLTELSLPRGGMLLLSSEEQRTIVPRVYTHLVNTAAGGSGANTMIGVALLGGTACFTSRVGQDDHGRSYRAGLADNGVQPNLADDDATGETGISLILVTPDAERTMCTYLGAARDLRPEDVRTEDLQASRYVYITGYLWDTEGQKEAVRFAMQEAQRAHVPVAFSLSDPFCVGRHRDDFVTLLAEYVDVVFANEEEAYGMTGASEPEEALERLIGMTRGGKGIAVMTCNKDGSLIGSDKERHTIPPYRVAAVDTTGAGDMYAAGLLYGLTHDLPLPAAGRIASYCAAQVVARMGPRLDQIDNEAIRLLQPEFADVSA